MGTHHANEFFWLPSYREHIVIVPKRMKTQSEDVYYLIEQGVEDSTAEGGCYFANSLDRFVVKGSSLMGMKMEPLVFEQPRMRNIFDRQ